MNIQTVIHDLDISIMAREQYLKEAKQTLEYYSQRDATSAIIQFSTVIGMLESIIPELKCMRDNLALCIPPVDSAPYHEVDAGVYGTEYQDQ